MKKRKKMSLKRIKRRGDTSTLLRQLLQRRKPCSRSESDEDPNPKKTQQRIITKETQQSLFAKMPSPLDAQARSLKITFQTPSDVLGSSQQSAGGWTTFEEEMLPPPHPNTQCLRTKTSGTSLVAQGWWLPQPLRTTSIP
ncbi:Hypothetical protein FKW44_020294 [Caligus rogercresseyi]|uniref:Uncharacterized protein n=1 Tax=Caligus rogercresseyi TaxID=217165 RepID=A0A7T8JY03_CALRO|nr:Hypothetical protein FKW44_020294 [Caligus rogercresseyi]